jgi:hypothetical protein
MKQVEPPLLLPWRELFPNGRHIYYEGDDPDGFAAEIRTEFGFDPTTIPNSVLYSANPLWGLYYPADDRRDAFISYSFHCPPGILDAIYGSDRWPMGS